MARGAWVTGIIGVILVVAMIWYFRFGFGKVAELLEPDQIVSLIGVQVGNSLPEIRKSVQSTVKD
jgi:Ca2+/Na+ antiporter